MSTRDKREHKMAPAASTSTDLVGWMFFGTPRTHEHGASMSRAYLPNMGVDFLCGPAAAGESWVTIGDRWQWKRERERGDPPQMVQFWDGGSQSLSVCTDTSAYYVTVRSRVSLIHVHTYHSHHYIYPLSCAVYTQPVYVYIHRVYTVYSTVDCLCTGYS